MVELPEPFATPHGVSAQQATHAIQGYTYQIYASCIAWLDLNDEGLLLLEVAEDYALVVQGALRTVQVRNTMQSGAISLRSSGVVRAIENLWRLSQINAGKMVTGVYLSTSTARRERISAVPPASTGLDEWAYAQANGADTGLIRTILNAVGFCSELQAWIERASDEELRQDLLNRMSWRLGEPPLAKLADAFMQRVVGRCEQFGLFAHEANKAAQAIFHKVLELAGQSGERQLDRAQLNLLIQEATLVLAPPRAARGADSRTRAYVPPLDLRVRGDGGGRLFFFGDADRADFVGRLNAASWLHEWANQELDFSWTLITGVGGMGKSRLAFEVCLRLAEEGWHTGFLSHGTTLSEAKRFAEFHPDRPTFIVIDYVGLNPRWAGELVTTLIDATTIERFSARVRVVLLERTGTATAWFHEFSSNQGARLMGHASRPFAGSQFLELGGLEDEERWALFKNVVQLDRPGERSEDLFNIDWWRDNIEEALGRIDPHRTPLFTSLAAESTREGREIWQFSQKALLNDIFAREQLRWRSLATEADLSLHERACALATMVGGLPIRQAARLAAVEAFPFDNTRYNEPLVRAINGPSPSSDHIVAMEPDILGEWFVMRKLVASGPFDKGPEALRRAANKMAEQSAHLRWGYAAFRARLAQDFPREALATGLYQPPDQDAPPEVHATWLALMAEVIEGLAQHEAELAPFFDAILATRAAFPADGKVQANAVAAIAIYSTVQAGPDAVIGVAQLIKSVDWPEASVDFVESARALSHAALAVGHELARIGQTGHALSIFEFLRRKALSFAASEGMPVDDMMRDAAVLGLHIRASYRNRGDSVGVAAMNFKLWRASRQEGDLAPFTADVLANFSSILDIEAPEGAVAELLRRSELRPDVTEIMGAAAQAMFADLRAEDSELSLVEGIRTFALWLGARLDNPNVRQVFSSASRAGWFEPNLELGATPAKQLLALWLGAIFAANDAGRDYAQDPQVVDLGAQLKAVLNAVPEADWANDVRASLRAIGLRHSAAYGP